MPDASAEQLKTCLTAAALKLVTLSVCDCLLAPVWTSLAVLGKLLTRPRTLPEMDQDMVDSLNELVVNNTADINIEDTVVLCFIESV